jgi:large subunit ribosomal protein L25
MCNFLLANKKKYFRYVLILIIFYAFMSQIILNCVARAEIGKSASKKFRAEGLIPLVVYTKDGKNINLLASLNHLLKLTNEDPSFLNRTFVLKVFEGIENKDIALFKTEITAKPKNEIVVVVKDMQFSATKDIVSHIDFKETKIGAKEKIKVAVKFENRLLSNALKFGGMLQVFKYNPEIIATVGSFPEYLLIDLTGMSSGTVIKMSNMKLPEGCSMVREFDIAKVCGKKGL